MNGPDNDLTRGVEGDRYPSLGLGPRIEAVLRGISIFVATGQHGPVHLSTSTGVNVLYGLNGAGKSVTLSLLGTLFGTRPSSEELHAFAQVAIEPKSLLAVALDDAGVTNLVDQIGGQLMEAFHRRIPAWDRDPYEGMVDLDPSDNMLAESSTFGGVVEALVTSTGLSADVATAVADGGRYLLRPQAGGGADVYLGLPVDSPALAEFWANGESLHALLIDLEPLVVRI